MEQFIRDNKNLITTKVEENCYYNLADKDQGSGFYFRIYIDPTKTNVDKPDNPTKLLCEYAPNNLAIISSAKIYLLPHAIKPLLEAWVSYIVQYNGIESVYDDPILKSYEEYFFEEFFFIYLIMF